MEHSWSNGEYYYRLYWAHALIKQYLATGRKHALIKKYVLNRHVRLLTRLYGMAAYAIYYRKIFKDWREGVLDITVCTVMILVGYSWSWILFLQSRCEPNRRQRSQGPCHGNEDQWHEPSNSTVRLHVQLNLTPSACYCGYDCHNHLHNQSSNYCQRLYLGCIGTHWYAQFNSVATFEFQI